MQNYLSIMSLEISYKGDKMKDEIVYVLKKVNDIKGKLYSYNNTFRYPRKGWVVAHDWENNTECGHGLHGQEWSTGDFYIENYGDTFIVLKVNKKDGYVNLGDKIKFRKGYVVKVTKDSKEVIDYIKSKAPKGLRFNYDNSSESVVNQGYWSTSNQGSSSTSNQGYRSTSNQGSSSTSNQGSMSTSNQGNSSTSNQGNSSTSNQGYSSTSNQGYSSTSNQGYSSTSNQGSMSTSNQGYSSTSNQGYSSTSNQGSMSTSNQGNSSTSNQGNSSTSNQEDSSTSNQGYRSTSTIHGSSTIYRNSSDLGCCVMFYNDKMTIIKAVANTSLYIEDGEVKYKYTYTPDKIDELKTHEVFVFGSNLNGNHAGGAAKLALDKFGAVEGIGEGLRGNSYAFPTLDKDMKQIPLKDWEEHIKKLIKTANDNTRKIFFVTKLGCGIAGFNEEDVAKLFRKRNDISANIILPKGWRKGELR